MSAEFKSSLRRFYFAASFLEFSKNLSQSIPAYRTDGIVGFNQKSRFAYSFNPLSSDGQNAVPVFYVPHVYMHYSFR